MKIDEMLEKYCKNGVRFYKLDEIVDFLNGKGHEKNIVEHGRYIVVNSKFISTDGDTQKFSNEQICPVYKDDILMVMSDLPNGRALAKCFYVEDDDKYTLNQRICALRVKDKDLINIRFLYYYLNRNRQLLRYDNGVDQTNLRKDDILNIRVAVPPLEVQCEIVHILDDFTLLSAELSAELKARQKQYEYYASKLFTSFKAKEYSMGELAKFVYGYTDKAVDNGNTRFIRITDINEQGCLKKDDIKYINMNEDAQKSLLKKGDLVMARTGATFGKTLYFDDDFPSVYASFLIKIIPDNTKLLNKYYWHFTKTQLYWSQANRLVTNGGQPQFNTPALKKIRIPIPTIDEQHKVVNILDRLDKICNDISEGLPAEIVARQKQYEYYRDKLLTFKEC